MIHSFRKHGASPTAPARVPRTPRRRRMVPGPPATAPPPYARLTLWLLRAVPPTPPGSQAQTPARFGKEPVGPTRSAAGRRRGRTWGTLGAVSEDAGRQERSGAHGGGGGRGEEARDGGAGTESPPPPLSPSWGGGVPWAARLPVQERRVLAHPPLLTGLSPWSIARAGSYLGEPGSQLQTRSRAGAWSLGGRWLRLPGPSLPRSRGRGWRSRRRRGVEGRRRKGARGGRGRGGGRPPRLAPPVPCRPGLRSPALYPLLRILPPEPRGAPCLVSPTRAHSQPSLRPRRPHITHPRSPHPRHTHTNRVLKGGRLLNTDFDFANIYCAPSKCQALCQGLGVPRAPRQGYWI